MTKYRTNTDFDWPLGTAQSIGINSLKARNEYSFRHMPLHMPRNSCALRLEMDNSCNALSCEEDRRNGYKGLYPPPRGYVVPGIYLNWNGSELWSACFGLCHQAVYIGLKSEAHVWQKKQFPK